MYMLIIKISCLRYRDCELNKGFRARGYEINVWNLTKFASTQVLEIKRPI